jgi:protein SMG6
MYEHLFNDSICFLFFRRFNNTFLYIVGKLFTHINMESFGFTLESLLREFRHLVSRSPLPIDSKRLVQIMSLNMFVVEHARLKSSVALRDAALKMAFDVFGVLLERCNALLTGFRPVVDLTSQCIFEEEEDLPTLLAAVKVWCDWLVGNNETWGEVAAAGPFEQLAALATHLEALKPALRNVLNQLLTEDEVARRPDRTTSFELVKLGEDALLCGFAPWLRGLEWSVYRRWAPRSIPPLLAQDARRLDAINFAVDFLEGLDPPVLKWSPPDSAHVSLVRPQGPAENQMTPMRATGLVPPDVLDESYSDDEPYQTRRQQPVDEDDKIGQLRRRRDELERRRAEEERLRRRALAERVCVTVEIRPRYVVPDTNCFISFLSEIRQLASSAPHLQLRVPLVVVAELEGLAKGARPVDAAKYPNREHAAMVEENAGKALAFFRERPPSNIKCITSKV